MLTAEKVSKLLEDGKKPVDLSIRKWEAGLEEVDTSEEIDMEVLRSLQEWPTCALCHVYHFGACEDCPVFKKTKMRCCNGTPFEDFDNMFALWEYDEIEPEREELKKVIQAEINFLKEIKKDMEKDEE